jgi:hypothetical protein
MLAIAYWYDSATLWTAIAAIVAIATLLGTLIGIVQAYRSTRRSIAYGMLISAPLVSAPPGVEPGLSVLHRGRELADPRVLRIRLTSKGHRDIPSSFFDQGRPLCIDVGIPVVALLQASFEPKSEPSPKVEADGTTLKIGPSLIRKHQAMTFTVLADGSDVLLAFQNPLIDVALRREVQHQVGQGILSRIVVWGITIFIVLYMVVDPNGASTIIHNFANGLSSFISSL